MNSAVRRGRIFQFALCMLALSLYGWTTPTRAQEQIRPAYTAEFVAQMLDYVSRDYAMAVSDGQVIDHDEYEEQLVVCNAALEVGDQIQSLVKQPSIRVGIVGLIEQIRAKAAPSAIKRQALAVRDQIFEAAGTSMSPQRWPSLVQGKKVFEARCAACHGQSGDGRGTSSAGMTPSPTNFLDPIRMKALSPRSSYAAVKMGIAGTAMAAQPGLSEDELWAVSFYVASLGQGKAARPARRLDATAASMWLKATATLPDEELMQALPGSASERKKLLTLLRLYSE